MTEAVELEAGETGEAVEALLAARAVTAVFQPVVDLRTGEVVGHEALSRGPADGPWHAPDELFAAAARAGRLAELDGLCRAVAVESALAAGLGAPLWLFLNVEPAAIAAGPASVEGFADWRRRGVQPVLELTERALTCDPARLLAYAEQARAAGLAVAVDDVGADPASLALIPFLRPDVVKLDLRLVQQRPDADVAAIMTAVTAHAERSGARVLAEGIETEAHERAARSLGATLGQGYRFGRPAALAPWATTFPAPSRPLLLHRSDEAETPSVDETPHVSPYAAVARRRRPQLGTKNLLVEVSRLLERQAAGMGGQAVVLATFQVAPNLTPASQRRYARLAETTAFVVVLGAGMPAEPVPGVRGAALTADDPVGEEWDVAVVAPHFAAALVARDRHEPRPEPERTFDYVLTYDRPLVLEIARALMRRALPAPVLADTVGGVRAGGASG